MQFKVIIMLKHRINCPFYIEDLDLEEEHNA